MNAIVLMFYCLSPPSPPPPSHAVYVKFPVRSIPALSLYLGNTGA